MRIKEIEVDNFKSFRSKTTIPILDGFTTISGPNGSGKSNIIDCVLFALGLSTSRTLRAEKLTDLINNNNQKREASVIIKFTDDNNENKEFEIKRKIKEGPNGYTSTYYLNGHVTTLGDIHRLLSDYNISPGCYNVMMQGDVTGIINMGPVERRKIIDEIAGVTEFDRRIEQATKELETVQDRIERSNIILGEIDVRLEQLATEREQALKYKELKDKRQNLIDQIALVKYADLKKSLTFLQETINDSTKEKSVIEKNLLELEQNIIKGQQTLDELNEIVKTKGENEQINLFKQVETLKGELFRKQQSIDNAQQKLQDNNATINRAYSEINKLNENIDDTQLKIETKQEQYRIIEKQLEKENNELQKLIEESGELNKTAREFIHQRNQHRKDLDIAEDEHSRLTRENLKWADIHKRLSNELAELEYDLKNSDQEKASLFENKNTLIKEISNLEEEKNACEVLLNNVINEIKQTKNDINTLDTKINKETRQLMQLEANKNASEFIHKDRAVEAILSSGIYGVHKTLAQLGKVEDEFSTALEIAMGGRMKCIVVDNEHVGSEAIEYLKQNRLGRATFLPLNKIKYYLPSCKLPNVDGVIDFAINLIEFDNLYKNAFFYALGETLVVRDLKAAKPLMGEYRMVTLDGSLIEKTGAMTGGSLHKNSFKFTNNFDDEISELKKRIRELQDEKDQLLDKLEELDRKLERNRQDYSCCLNEKHKKQLELDNINNTLNNLDGILSNKAKRIEDIKPELERADLEVLSNEEDLEETNNKILDLKSLIETIDASIPEDKLDKLEELTGNIEFEIKNLETKLRNIDAEIKSITMEKSFKEQSLNIQKEKIEHCNNDNNELDKIISNCNADINNIENNVTDLNKQLSLLSEELKETQKERDAAAKKLLSMQQQIETTRHNIQRIEETISAYLSRKKELHAQLIEIKTELNEKQIDYTKASEIEMTTEEINKSIDRLSKKMESLGLVNMLAINEYDEVLERKNELSGRINTLTSEKDEINSRLNSYENLKKNSFMKTYDNVNKNFKDIYADLSEGEGYLVLENPDDPFKGGLTIEARPRGKKLLRIEAMSGGEKSLTALAFVFAFQRYLPAPFYAFDEVDMHLDGVNVEKLAQMIKTQSSNTQFIVVSLRKPMLERADRTIGVTQRNDGISKVTGVKLHV